MRKVEVNLSWDQYEALQEFARREDVTPGEVMRRALDSFLRSHRFPPEEFDAGDAPGISSDLLDRDEAMER